jgi:tetratricopeptide (TPR) repeat protein
VAHNLYLQARSYRGQATLDAFQQAISYLNRAIERDPKYAAAYAALAGVYASGAANLATEPLQFVPQTKAAAAKAIELDPFSGSAYAAIGFVDALVLMDWKKGERELRDAIRLMPESATAHNWLGITLMVQGRFPEALAELRTAEDLDPLAAGAGITVGLAYTMARRYDGAVGQLTKVQRLHPDAIMVHPFLGSAWEGKGDFDRAMAEYQLAFAKVPSQVKDRIAHLLAAEGRKEEARRMLAEIEHPKPGEGIPDGLGIAAVHAALGDRDEAFVWLTRAYEARRIAFLKVHPFLDPLRDDPRFGELLKKAGLE